MSGCSPQVQMLLNRGVKVVAPGTVHVATAVDVGRIDAAVTIHPGCRLLGSTLSIGPGCELGREAPMTVEDCQLAGQVELKGGFAAGAVFLEGAALGSGAHVRAPTLLEEQASGAHTVGLKQTVLMPFVTLGSLVNFCDCLMAGGTDRRNHSEVGSSYVHFNYTPHQDKATASLLGDVPHGVMLDQRPIFLGGQGGLVGPRRIAYGTTVAAGSIYRHDVTEPGALVFGQFLRATGSAAYDPRRYGDIRRQVAGNLAYIGNLCALEAWYRLARAPFLARTPCGRNCLEGALKALAAMRAERIQRLGELAARMPEALAAVSNTGADLAAEPFSGQRRLAERWPEAERRLRGWNAGETGAADRDLLLAGLAAGGQPADYLDAVNRLDRTARAAGTRWLQAIVEAVAAQGQALLS
jgi:hypothetical protein